MWRCSCDGVSSLFTSQPPQLKEHPIQPHFNRVTQANVQLFWEHCSWNHKWFRPRHFFCFFYLPNLNHLKCAEQTQNSTLFSVQCSYQVVVQNIVMVDFSVRLSWFFCAMHVNSTHLLGKFSVPTTPNILYLSSVFFERSARPICSPTLFVCNEWIAREICVRI